MWTLLLLSAVIGHVLAFELASLRSHSNQWYNARFEHVRCLQVVSPFDNEDQVVRGAKVCGPLPLTLENVELVLDEMRPYLLADGGNVAVRDIDGATVILELQGACGSCPSSSMTMKLGLERGLLEKIPEIVSVEQVSAEGTQLTEVSGLILTYACGGFILLKAAATPTAICSLLLRLDECISTFIVGGC